MTTALTVPTGRLSPRHQRDLRLTVISLVGALFAGFAFNLIWWGLLSPEANAAGVVEVTIPAGTADSVAGGASGLFLSGVEIRPGGTLVIQNNDSVTHTVGEFKIKPGESASVPAPEASAQFNCSITGSGVLGFHILKRPPFTSMFWPSFLLGAPLGVLAAISLAVTTRLNLDDAGPAHE